MQVEGCNESCFISETIGWEYLRSNLGLPKVALQYYKTVSLPIITRPMLSAEHHWSDNRIPYATTQDMIDHNI